MFSIHGLLAVGSWDTEDLGRGGRYCVYRLSCHVDYLDLEFGSLGLKASGIWLVA